VVKQTSLTEEFDYDDFRFHYKGAALPLFAVKESGELVIFDAEHAPSPKPGQTLVSLVGPDIVGVNDAGSDHEPGPAATGP
jgi:hypothetical protein